MTIPHVRDLKSPPEIGKFYIVPCIKALRHDRWRSMPVIGPRHDDIEFIGVKRQQ